MTTDCVSMIAAHEAGHMVANIRHGIDCYIVTIIPNDARQLLGEAVGSGDDVDTESAGNRVLSLCAGYASAIAAGYPESDAIAVCGDDFEKAEEIIARWGLPPLNVWPESAYRFVQEPRNAAAILLIATELLKRRSMDGDLCMVLVEVADGESTQDDLERYLMVRSLLI